MDRPGVRRIQERSEEQGKMEETGCKVICGAPTTPEVKMIGEGGDGKGLVMFLRSGSHIERRNLC